MAKSSKQNPDGYDVPRGALDELRAWVKRVKAREVLGYLAGEFCDYRIDDTALDGDQVVEVYATIQFGRDEDHSGWLQWEEIKLTKADKDWIVEPL